MAIYTTRMLNRATLEPPLPETAATPKKKRVRGRYGQPHKLAGLDMRSAEGQIYRKHFKLLEAEFGQAELVRIRELAALRALLERSTVEAMSPDVWVSLRARDQLPPLLNAAKRIEAALRAAKATREAETAKPAPTLADYIAARSKASAGTGEG